MQRIVLYPSFRCNYTCPYCYEKEFPSMKERSWKEWLKVFNTQDRLLIDISGGEPFLFPNFVKMVKRLSERHTIALTTNFTRPKLLKSLKEYVQGVTLSYHPYATEWKPFLRRAKEMQKTFPDLSVNIVLYPSILETARKVLDDLKSNMIRHHAEPYIYPYIPYTDEQKEIVRTLAGEDRKIGWQWPDEHTRHGRICRAGIEQQHWMPNGDVFACGTYLMMFMLNKISTDRRYYLGNLFDDTYSPRTESIRCNLPCVVGCDADFHKDVWHIR